MRRIRKPCLITGGCGFVGRNLVKKLLLRDCDIWIIDDLSIGQHPDKWLDKEFTQKVKRKNFLQYKKGAQTATFIIADVVDLLNREIRNSKNRNLPEFSDVFHLASIVGGRELIEGDPILVGKDLAIDAIFFLWLTRRAKGVGRVLYASSSAAYPINFQRSGRVLALKEDYINFDKQVGVPDMTYGWSKLTGEYLSKLTSRKYSLPISCVRPFSGYGEDQDFSYPIPAITRRVAKREDPLVIWGTGKQGRDFIHIDDCIEAFFLIMDRIKDGSACNIGSGKLTSFLEVLQIFTKLEGYDPKIKPLLDKPVGVTSRFADTSLIKSFGWRPKISNETGFSRVLKYIKNYRI